MELRPLCVFLLMTGLIHCTQTGQGVQGGTNRETEGVTGDGEMKPETGEEVQGGTNRETEGVTGDGEIKPETGEEVQGGTKRETEGVTGDGEIKPETGEEVQGGTKRETEGVTGDGEIKPETTRPKPAVKVQPAEGVFIGETVTLTCEIQTGESWRYLWYRNNEELSDAAGKKTHTITDIKDSDKGDYTCNGTQSSDPKYTQTSDAVTVTVSEKPKPTVSVNPQSSVYTGDRVTLTCNLLSTGWTFFCL
ncbi:carcinoembryonic antigen-related cell adhesion molecule 5 [Ictalurus furcatus]|uniref:carcinoembryonic antigen-related cell adhesion molecule 5 n=1 Tax=Ictalurus furcatus TaxID=66913 RepID=UPI002350483F|nr:carcinoembryonic antigen-related cell adhesion molecule 5 [Ictalurus furcatus]